VGNATYDVLDLKALRCFWAAAMQGSLTRAGIELGVSEAAVSQRIHALERYLGVKLYESRGGRIRLTSAGEQTLEMAIGLFSNLEDFEKNIAQEGATGTLTLASSEGILRNLLPDVAQRFGEQFPLVRLRLLRRSVPEILKLVRTNEIDAGVLIERVLPEDIVFRPIRVYKSYLVLQRGHALVRRGVPKVDELLREDIVRRYPLVVAEKDDPDDTRLEDTLARHNLPFNVALEAGTEETLKYYVLRGLGIAVLSGISLDDADRKLFEVIEIPGEYGGDNIYGAIMRRDKHISQPLRSLLVLLGARMEASVEARSKQKHGK
jgi:DNA-binding transcriptional LysR family regulator